MSKILVQLWADFRVVSYCKPKQVVSVNMSYYARKSFLSKHQVPLSSDAHGCSFASYSAINSQRYRKNSCRKCAGNSGIISSVTSVNNFHYAKGNWYDQICKYSVSAGTEAEKKEKVLTGSETEKKENVLTGTETQKIEKDEPEKKLTLYQKFKAMYRDYWYILVPVHLVTSAGWFGGFYYMAKTGVDIIALLETLHVSEKIIEPLRSGSTTTGYLALAYALYKISTPLRYTVTIGGTTISINYLKKWGYIKPVPSKEKLKEMYKEHKETLKERKDVLKENVIKRKDELKDNVMSRLSKTVDEAKKKT